MKNIDNGIQKYKIENCLFKNENISIFKAISIETKKIVIIKHEVRDIETHTKSSIISSERKMLNFLKRVPHIPKIIDSHNSSINNYIVIEHLGNDLFYYFLKNKSFSLGFCGFFMTEALTILENIHKNKICHCDIKPSNFIFNEKENKIYLIDFSVARNECYNTNKIVGTPKFCSYFCHEKCDYTYRDDLLSLGYVLLYFFLGFLPWEKNIIKNNKESNYFTNLKNIKRNLLLFLKNNNSIPEEFIIYLNYCYSLNKNSIIDYKKLYDLFVRIIKNSEYSKEKLHFELNNSETVYLDSMNKTTSKTI